MRKFQKSVHQTSLTGGLATIVLGAVLLLFPFTAVAQDYEGSEFCAGCHEENYNLWKVSGHPYKLMKSEEARNRPIPLPEDLSWDDVTYVIGGYKWKSRYLDSEGYIYTPSEGQNQYNNLTGEWSDYHAGEVKPYDCGSCHTTAWVANENPEDVTGNQDELPGLHGTFEFGGIHCEECHGPGFGSMTVDNSAAFCGTCHIRGEANTIPASGGFIRHHEQYNEMLAGPHASFDCVRCHNPHSRGEFSIWKDGERPAWSGLPASQVGAGAQCGIDCHSSKMESFSQTTMYDYGVTCEDCHMPFATKSAQALGPHQGDLKTHIFYIDTDPNANMFTEDGGFVDLDSSGKAAVTMDFACQRCHETASLDELALFARDFHNPDKSLEGFGLDPGLSGTWWNPAQSGEGFLLEVDANSFLYASFYTYGPDGEQTWLVAALDTAAGTTANVKVYKPEGGTWGDPSTAETGVEWGIGTFTFPSCTSATFLFTPNSAMEGMGYTQITYELERTLPSGIACPTFVNNAP